jgi:hypothetical protein
MPVPQIMRHELVKIVAASENCNQSSRTAAHGFHYPGFHIYWMGILPTISHPFVLKEFITCHIMYIIDTFIDVL